MTINMPAPDPTTRRTDVPPPVGYRTAWNGHTGRAITITLHTPPAIPGQHAHRPTHRGRRASIAAILTAILFGLATPAPATAAPSPWYSQATTRATNAIPASVTYISGSSVWVTESRSKAHGIRCFTGKATKTTRVQGVKVKRGRYVGYCTDGYVDHGTANRPSTIINPGH